MLRLLSEHSLRRCWDFLCNSELRLHTFSGETSEQQETLANASLLLRRNEWDIKEWIFPHVCEVQWKLCSSLCCCCVFEMGSIEMTVIQSCIDPHCLSRSDLQEELQLKVKSFVVALGIFMCWLFGNDRIQFSYEEPYIKL